MSGICKPAFSLIEIMVVISIIGLMAALIIPALGSLRRPSELKQFTARLNELTAFAWRTAVATNKVHMVFFDMKSRKISVAVVAEGQGKGAFGEPKSTPLRGSYLKSSFTIPSALKIEQFFVEGVDLIENKNKATFQAWFFIVPNGLAQAVELSLVDTKSKINGKMRREKLLLNPFNAQFAVVS